MAKVWTLAKVTISHSVSEMTHLTKINSLVGDKHSELLGHGDRNPMHWFLANFVQSANIS